MTFYPESEIYGRQPLAMVPYCGKCGLFKTCSSPKMPYSGKGRKRVLIVAEAPGEEEDKRNLQLVGNSGQLLERILKEIGVQMRFDCWLTNALICRPKGNKIKDEKQIGYCRANLIQTINETNPDVIILLGQVAVQSLIPYVWSENIGKFSRWPGWQIPCQKLNAWICPTWHPAYLLYKNDRVIEMYFRHHLEEAFALEGKPWEEVPDYPSQVIVDHSGRDAIDFLDQITSGVVAFDYETDRLKPESKESDLVCCSVCCNGEETIAFPMLGKAINSLKRLLEDKRVGKIASNCKFEDRWSKTWLDVRVRNWVWDTMLSAHLIDCRRNITSIKFQSFVHLGVPIYNERLDTFLEAKKKGGNNQNRVREIGMTDLLKYCGMDSLLEYKVAEKQAEYLGMEL